MWVWIFWVVASLLLAAGATAFVARLRGRWPKTSGMVSAARLAERERERGTEFYPMLDLTYTIAGKPYEAMRVPVPNVAHAIRKRAESHLETTYPVGRNIAIAYDPAWPERVRIV